MERTLLGADIGTTTISYTVIKDGEQIFSDTIPNSFDTPDALVNGAIAKVEALAEKYGVCAVGLTGQMHGVLCVDGEGNAVSDFYNWQTVLCEEKIGELTYTEKIRELCGETVPCGYGLSTLYYLIENGKIGREGYKICTIADYLGMKLTRRKSPLLHASNAASLGLFDIENARFKTDKIEKLGISPAVLPAVVNAPTALGEYGNIPVFAAIGDNQASVFAALGGNGGSLCINCGTGAQVSLVSDRIGRAEEVRPYISGDYLLCGSAICGGSAYAALARFFSETLKAFGATAGDVYGVMNSLAESDGAAGLKIDTRFSGTRADGSIRGSVSGISTDNFTPAALVKGTLQGMAEELYSLYLQFGVSAPAKIVATGNAVKKNPAFVKVLADTFKKEIEICPLNEEAACGAALLAELRK